MRFRLPPPPFGHLPPKGGGKGQRIERKASLAPPMGGSCRRSRLRGVSAVLVLLLTLTACAPKMEELSTTVFAMDTVMNLAVYDAPAGPISGEFQEQVDALYQYEGLFSATKEGSDVHNLNANCGENVKVSFETADLLRRALALCEKTGGALDITAYPAVKEWGFTTGEYRVVSEDECVELAEHIDYTRVELLGDYTALPEGMTEESMQGMVNYEEHLDKGELVRIPEGMQLDLGAVAKGYVGDRMVEALEPYQCHALLNLGQSTIAAIGTKPDGSAWRIGIQDPAGSDYLGVLELNDQSMGSSGNYQRWFEENGVRYGHIIDPDTAAPAHSGLAGVTVVSDSALLCDGLSTALFVMGLEEAADHWREYRDFEAIFIEDSGKITITAGLKEHFSLTDGYKDREVTVLE